MCKILLASNYKEVKINQFWEIFLMNNKVISPCISICRTQLVNTQIYQKHQNKLQQQQ